MNELEFTRLLTTYYHQPRPDRIPEALAWFAASAMSRALATAWPAVYFFVRVAHMHPAVIERYRAVRETISVTGATFIDQVLDLISQCPSKESLRVAMREMTSCEAARIERICATMPIDAGAAAPPNVMTCLEMDCLWAEFCTTGDAETVLPIIDVLGWPDLVRYKLDDWLSSNARTSSACLSRWRRTRVLRRLWLTCDEATGRVGSPEDVDCFCAIQGMQLSGERFTKFRTALPFDLTEDEQNYIAIKAVAFWSLCNNVAQHPRILELCRRQMAVGGRRAGISLAGIIQSGGHARPLGDSPD